VNVLDANVVLALHRPDHPHHERASRWWVLASDRGESFTVPDSTWVGVVRLATDPRVFVEPTPVERVWEFVAAVRAVPSYLEYAADVRVLQQFTRICTGSSVRGPLVPDAYLAAVAASLGAVVVTFDRDFRKLDGVQVHEVA